MYAEIMPFKIPCTVNVKALHLSFTKKCSPRMHCDESVDL